MSRKKRKAYIEKMGNDFYHIVFGVAEKYQIALEELYVQKGQRHYWHALTRELNEIHQFDSTTHELQDLTSGKVKCLVKSYFGELLGFHGHVEKMRLRRATAAH